MTLREYIAAINSAAEDQPELLDLRVVTASAYEVNVYNDVVFEPGLLTLENEEYVVCLN